MNPKRVERLWRRAGLKVPQQQPKRGRLWLTDGSYIRRRAEYRHHVWAYAFVAARTHDGRPFRILTIIDEYMRECLAIKVARSIRSHDVLDCLADLCMMKGVPEHIRSDNGPEFTARVVRSWIGRVGAKTLFIEPDANWSGVKSPFLVGCHWSARSGWQVFTELVTDALYPEQKGQPFPPEVRSVTVDFRS